MSIRLTQSKNRGGLSLRLEDAYEPHRKRDAAAWAAVARRYRRTSGDDSDESLYSLAVNRLANGDVSDTEGFGIRVECRDDLGDDRVRAAAYWPDRKRCLCWSMKSRGFCSHDLAARIFRFAEEEHDN